MNQEILDIIKRYINNYNSDKFKYDFINIKPLLNENIFINNYFIPFQTSKNYSNILDTYSLNNINFYKLYNDKYFFFNHLLQSSKPDKASKDGNHKAHGRHIIPREYFLARELGGFLAHVHSTGSVIVRGYQGERPPFFQAPNVPLTFRQRIYQAVKQLPIFRWGEHPDMKNGHLRVKNKNVIERCLTLEVPEKGIQAAIYFTINLETKNCEIEQLGVNAEFKGKHFGSILLHSAIFIALHYQCKEIALLSSIEGETFYPGQGFKIINSKYRLRFSDSESYALFLEKMKLTCPSFDKDKLDSLLRISRPLPHKKEMLNQWMATQSLRPVKSDAGSLSNTQDNAVLSRRKNI